jgi:magnesium chelatase family protein
LRTINSNKYQKRISGLLLYRIDIHIEVPRVDYEKLSSNIVGESSESKLPEIYKTNASPVEKRKTAATSSSSRFPAEQRY